MVVQRVGLTVAFLYFIHRCRSDLLSCAADRVLVQMPIITSLFHATWRLLYLRPDPIDVDSPAPLSDFVLSQAVDLPMPVPPAEPDPATDAKKKPASSASGSAGRSLGSGSGEVKVPKWLKLSMSSGLGRRVLVFGRHTDADFGLPFAEK